MLETSLRTAKARQSLNRLYAQDASSLNQQSRVKNIFTHDACFGLGISE